MAAQTTPDLSEFIAASKPKKRPCQVGEARDALTAEDVAKLDAACATQPTLITAGAIAKFLEKRGHSANSSAITHHRKGACTCAE